jgi:RNA polymerase sigma factor (sigma-70 family)
MMGTESALIGRELERLFSLGAAGSMTDPQLIEVFLEGDERTAACAFEAIVERHGPRVLETCRKILGDLHAAEDAFQATFLVLARKAGGLKGRELLGNWLHGVAVRTARKARSQAAKQRAREREIAACRAGIVEKTRNEASTDEVNQVLHEEIGRLPKEYRSAVKACYVEGKSQTQAAAQLCVSKTTIRGRLARARLLLKRKLTLRDIGELFAMSVSRFKTGAAVIAVSLAMATPCVLLVRPAASARSVGSPESVQQEASATEHLLAVTAFSAVNVAPSQEAESNTNRSEQPAVDPELAKLVDGSIVRSASILKDCMILSYLPAWDHGDVDNIGIGNNDGGNRMLIDWPAVPAEEAKAPENRFVIAVYSRETISHPPAGPIHAFEIAEAWEERTSWSTRPSYHPEPVATYQFKEGNGWKIFDITPLVRAQAKAGRGGHGVMFRFVSEELPPPKHSDYKCVSREATGEWQSRRPVLLVVKSNER